MLVCSLTSQLIKLFVEKCAPGYPFEDPMNGKKEGASVTEADEVEVKEEASVTEADEVDEQAAEVGVQPGPSTRRSQRLMQEEAAEPEAVKVEDQADEVGDQPGTSTRRSQRLMQH